MTRMSAYDRAKARAGFVLASERQACRNCAHRVEAVHVVRAYSHCKLGGFYVTEMAVCNQWTAIAALAGPVPPAAAAAQGVA